MESSTLPSVPLAGATRSGRWPLICMANTRKSYGPFHDATGHAHDGRCHLAWQWHWLLIHFAYCCMLWVGRPCRFRGAYHHRLSGSVCVAERRCYGCRSQYSTMLMHFVHGRFYWLCHGTASLRRLLVKVLHWGPCWSHNHRARRLRARGSERALHRFRVRALFCLPTLQSYADMRGKQKKL